MSTQIKSKRIPKVKQASTPIVQSPIDPPQAIEEDLNEVVFGDFSIRVEGFEGAARARSVRLPKCRHFVLAYTQITGKGVPGSPAEAFEVVARSGDLVTIRLKEGRETSPLQGLSADTHFGTNFFAIPRHTQIGIPTSPRPVVVPKARTILCR